MWIFVIVHRDSLAVMADRFAVEELNQVEEIANSAEGGKKTEIIYSFSSPV